MKWKEADSITNCRPSGPEHTDKCTASVSVLEPCHTEKGTARTSVQIETIPAFDMPQKFWEGSIRERGETGEGHRQTDRQTEVLQGRTEE